MLQNKLKASLLLSRNLSFFAFFPLSKRAFDVVKGVLASLVNPLREMLQNKLKAILLLSRNLSFLLFFCCQSELYQRAKSKKASLSASF
jgi:hypothetical protein